ncbi:hypothetical protein I3F58_01215 [Streptomyces sp. MUM 203J]|uniref:hypothetical protein n=1 Tax=Streptomyces sp. MUM 203J TaxID=2791990 RepID=UPI001F0472E5|nr:hypothetical protein [Streptomyces sp. MUM 203J]MCH0538200.1 hypothetical protein [Streptomyces sp. MUM 203J]
MPGTQNARQHGTTGQGALGNQGIAALYGGISEGGIGVNHGSVHQYYVAPGASPEERLRMAWRCLAAGLRERAAELVDEVLAQGHHTDEVRFVELLGVLSRRSAEQLTDADWTRLRGLRRLARAGVLASVPDPGGFRAATWTAVQLLTLHVAGADAAAGTSARAGQNGSGEGTAEPGPWPAKVPQARHARDGHGDHRGGPAGVRGAEEVTALLAALHQERRTDLEDHLRYVIGGITQRASGTARLVDDRTRRLANDRERRVPAFFTADPLPPRPPDPVAKRVFTTPLIGWKITAWLGGGYAVALLSLLLMAEMRANGGVGVAFGMVAWGLLVAGALYLAVRARARARTRISRLRELGDPLELARLTAAASAATGTFARMAAQRGAQAAARYSDAMLGPAGRRRARFRGKVADLVRSRFDAMVPDNPAAAVAWARDSDLARRELTAELTHAFWQSGTPAGLDWLIQRRARAEFDRWRQHGPRKLGEPGWAKPVMVLALLAGALFALALLGGVITIPALGCWAGAIAVGWYTVLFEADLARYAEQSAVYQDDQRTHKAWQAELLALRPDDPQMAEWLDLDQRHLLREMLDEHEMENRDIVYSFFVLLAAPEAVRARVAGGPVRYSAYFVKLFVLTESGVWVSTWKMDFATGTHSGRNDLAFRYESISTAMLETLVATPATGSGGGTVNEVSADREALAGAPGGDALVPREALRLVLENRQFLDIPLEDYALLEDAAESVGALRELARESSGAYAGFRVLAALATEGAEWFGNRRRHSREIFLGETPDERGAHV